MSNDRYEKDCVALFWLKATISAVMYSSVSNGEQGQVLE